MIKIIKEASNAPKPVGPYSPAVVCGNMVYVSGQVGIEPESGKLVEDGIENQTKQVLANLKAVLQAAGSEIHQIVMTTIFLTDINNGKIVNELYERFIDSESPPARQTVAVKELPLGALIEISLIATSLPR